VALNATRYIFSDRFLFSREEYLLIPCPGAEELAMRLLHWKKQKMHGLKATPGWNNSP